jgi:roadblock/LC7 domain-containing protein
MSDIPPEDKEVLLANFHELTSAPPRPALEGEEQRMCDHMVWITHEWQCEYCAAARITTLSAQLEAALGNKAVNYISMLQERNTTLSAQLDAARKALEAITESFVDLVKLDHDPEREWCVTQARRVLATDASERSEE